MQRVVDLSSDGLHVAVHRGFLTVSKDREEIGRIALDDIGGVVAHAHGLTWSNTVFTRLSERAVPIVLCSANHAPVACVWPLEGNHLQGARLNAQVDASRPLGKRVWRDIVIAKIRMQGAVLASVGAEAGAFEMLARKVRSGDPDNVEAQAARRYWQALMGPDFRRDQGGEGANALLNYGYTVLRATISRAICAALMEPYRPIIDRGVYNLLQDGAVEVSSAAKSALVALTTLDLPAPHGMSPLNVHATRLAQQLASLFAGVNEGLDLPEPLDLLAFAGLARAAEAP